MHHHPHYSYDFCHLSECECLMQEVGITCNTETSSGNKYVSYLLGIGLTRAIVRHTHAHRS